MKKGYEKVEDNRFCEVNEPMAVYVTAHNSHSGLYITLEDESLLSEVKDVLKMIKGIASVRIVNDRNDTAAINPFAELDETWGGNRDANDIAEELHSNRENTGIIEDWQK